MPGTTICEVPVGVLPEKISIQKGAIFQTHSIMGLGDIQTPNGRELKGFSWEGVLPGRLRKGDVYVRHFRKPKEMLKLFDHYINKKKKLRLECPGKKIKANVYLEKYDGDFQGGYGDFQYSISFVQAVELKINTVKKKKKKSGGGDRDDSPGRKVKTYTVVNKDNLWKIAQKFYGDGAKYPVIYEANKKVIGPNPEIIMPGMVLTIPK